MNAPAVACARRYSQRLAAKASGHCDVSDTQSVLSVPSCISARRSSRLGGHAVSAQIRRSARLAKLPRVCYVGMDGDEE
jgi:hypothetical protein